MSSQATNSPSEILSAKPALINSDLTSFPTPNSLPLGPALNPQLSSTGAPAHAPTKNQSVPHKSRSRSRRRGRRATAESIPPLPASPVSSNSMAHQINTTIQPGKSSHIFDIPYPSPPVLSAEELDAQRQQYQTAYQQHQGQPPIQAQPPSYNPRPVAQGQAQAQPNYPSPTPASYPSPPVPSAPVLVPVSAPPADLQSLQSHPAYAAALAQQAASYAAQRAHWDNVANNNNANGALSSFTQSEPPPHAARARDPTTEHPVQVPVRIVNPTDIAKPIPGSGGSSQGNLRLRLDLNLDVEITLKASIRGDLTLALL